jgi:hypothetical protein
MNAGDAACDNDLRYDSWNAWSLMNPVEIYYLRRNPFTES